MDLIWWILLAGLLTVGAAVFVFGRELRQRGYHRWLGPYVRQRGKRRAPAAGKEIHLLLCIADHYEPRSRGAAFEQGVRRVEHWASEYPRQLGRFQDSDGRPPRHSFFFPIEEYAPEYLDLLARLCRAGFGEVEIHYHHDGDTAENLRRELVRFRDLLVSRHGLLARHKETGAVGYAFIHGNWALCNSRPDGRMCGVNEEIDILRETGCFADLTFPSAPDLTQPPIINSIYHASNIAGRPRSHEQGMPAGAGPTPENSLLLIQGPLLLDWSRRKWGLLPKLENGCVQSSQPATLERVDAWLRACVQVPSRPDWYFAKLHAHGASEDAHEALLGPPMVRFHEGLVRRAQADPDFNFHYVTAREMVNLVKAAEAEFRGTVAEARDYLWIANLASAQG